MRVLVVDDSLLSRMLLRDAVVDLGHECLTARNGPEAWAVLEDQEVDVVVSDWVMPGFDGYELCQRVRTRTDVPYVYFVFLTVLRDAVHAVNGLKAGADHYLPKPLDPSELAATLHTAAEVIELHRRRKALVEIARHLAVERDQGKLFAYVAQQAKVLLAADAACVYASGRGGPCEGQPMERLVAIGPDARWPCRLAAAETAELTQSPDVLLAPIGHAGRKLGLLGVAYDAAPPRPQTGDRAALDVLAAMAATVFVNAERAELVQVVVAARELAHLLNNKSDRQKAVTERK